MKITDVEVFSLRLPEIAHRTNSSQDALIVRISTDTGIYGYGEVDSCPSVIKAIIEAPKSHTQVDGLRNLIMGENPLEIRRLWDKMYHGTLYFGRSGATLHAMAGIDLALWDIKGKVLELPVHQLLGGSWRNSITAYASQLFGLTVDETIARARQAMNRGFRAVKFGWEPFGQDANTDETMVRAIRETIASDTRLMVDVGLAWDVPTTLQRGHMLEPYDIFWLEEPLEPDNIVGYGKIAKRVPQRIAAGEQESSIDGFVRLMDQGSVDVIQIDMTRVGITQAMIIAELAQRRGVAVCNHAFTTGINIAAATHFLASIPNALMLEYCIEPGGLAENLVQSDVTLEDGKVIVPQSPGLGVDLNWDIVKKYQV